MNCLNYKLDAYISAIKGFLNQRTQLISIEGSWSCQKIDIFSKRLFYQVSKNKNTIIELELGMVKKMINLNLTKNSYTSINKGQINRFDYKS